MTRTATVNRPPGPCGAALCLDLLRRRDPLSLLQRLGRRYPHLAYLRLGRQPIYLLHRPDLVTALLVRHARVARKGRLQEGVRLLLGDGLLTSEGETHARQRRLIEPSLHRDRIHTYHPVMAQAAGEIAARWRDGARVDLARQMSAMTLAVVGRTLFGRGLERETAEIAACLDVLLSGFARHLVPGGDRWLVVPTPQNRRITRAAERLDRVARRLITEPAAEGSLLSALVRQMPPDRARDEALTLLLAGHETTATALTWAWWLLDRHPEVAHWWHDEIDHHPAGPEGLPRTRAVLAEAMRLYPPSWLLARRSTHTIELDGWTIPTGSLCVASQWVMHRDPRFWPDPHGFTPSRWLVSGRFDESAPGQPRGAYFPFGLGARSCVGRWFAWDEGVVLLATVGRRWRPHPQSRHRPVPLPSVTLRPRGGMPVILRRRPPPRETVTPPPDG